MPDRERVITGMEYCTNNYTCLKCPYHGLDFCIQELKQDVLSLLKEQETVEHALSVLKAHGWKDWDCEVMGRGSGSS